MRYERIHGVIPKYIGGTLHRQRDDEVWYIAWSLGVTVVGFIVNRYLYLDMHGKTVAVSWSIWHTSSCAK